MGKSKLRQAITNGGINIPEAAALPGSASKLPFVIVADDAKYHETLSGQSKNTYIPEDCADREDILNGVLIEGNWRQNTNPLISCQRISSRINYAKDVRDRFCNF
ncbi:hypothetical protein TNCV_1503131 [Trichonephila clavipes]|uniref:Uncharacterized protein n=1 Tax=Trichonephila clavipes TaxID=2585209 RepID=A0A8X6RQL3_TRICX|nr:hypothetical protein TNCV_1503131 [Trichonephila clavipes]